MSTGIGRLLFPSTVAVVGASDDRTKFGGRILHFLLHHRFAGQVFPVNARRESLLGLRAYPSLEALPEPADLAILAVPNAAISAALEACARRGVAGAVVVSTGFAEAGEDGRARQEAMAALARRTGLRIWGPNCMGFVNPAHRLALSSTYVLEVAEVPPGPTAVISQSGALMSALLDRALSLGLGLRFLGSTGNEVDVDAAELVQFFAADPGTKAIALYLEGVRRPEAFREALRLAERAGKPVVVLKVGRTAAGARAALSHTASLAGSDEVFDALCAHHGAIRVDDPDLLLLVPDLLARLPAPASDGIALVSPSGGACAYVADGLESHGLRLARLSEEGQARLGEVLGPISSRNPVDLGTPRDGAYVEAARRAVEVLGAEPDVGVVLLALTTIPDFARVLDTLMEGVGASATPWVVYSPLGRSAEDAFDSLRAAGQPLFLTLPHVLVALRAWIGRRRPRPPEAVATGSPPGVEMRGARGRRVLTEPEAKAFLAGVGIPPTRERLARTMDEAADHARQLGFPVVLKVVSPDVPHRARVGGLALWVGTEDELRRRFAAIVGNVEARVPRAEIDGVLVQECVQDAREVLLGAVIDRQFGPFVLVGTGGPEAELLGDRVLRPAPVSAAAALDMLERLRGRDRLLTAEPRRDVDALVNAIVRFSELVVALRADLESLDVNPLWVFEAGKGVAAGDALAILREPGQ